MTRRSAEPSKPALSIVARLRSSLVMGRADDQARGSARQERRKVYGTIGLGRLRSDAIAGTNICAGCAKESFHWVVRSLTMVLSLGLTGLLTTVFGLFRARGRVNVDWFPCAALDSRARRD
jgi:hypothetical protein